MKLRILALTALLSLGLLAVACSETPIEEETPVAATEVRVTDNKFGPRAIEVKAGSTVTWTFDGNATHDVVGEGWKSDRKNDGTYEHRFERAGIYDYLCSLHGNMTGRVIVTE